MPAGDPYDFKYIRLIELLDDDHVSLVRVLCDWSEGIDSVESAEFEWLRQGGCGGGTFTIDVDFPTDEIHIGQYIKCTYEHGTEWYLGRIESVKSINPGSATLVTYGMISVLSDVVVGGQAWWTRGPQTFGRYDYFSHDPDYTYTIYNAVETMQIFIQRMYDDYIAPLGIDLGTIDARTDAASFAALTFRGGETLSEILRICADLSNGASYGVDADGKFFFKPLDTSIQATYIEGDNVDIEREENRDLIYNRLILVGGYVYGVPGNPSFYVWNSHHEDTDSVAAYGARSLAVKLPYIRTHVEAFNFAASFLAKYSEPTTRYTGSTTSQSGALYPWEGSVKLIPADETSWFGETDVIQNFDSCKVSFNEAPLFTFTTGPEPPHYPEPDIDAAGELSGVGGGGGGGDAGKVSGWCDIILPGCAAGGSLDSCYWPPCDAVTCGFVVKSAYPTDGYVIGDIYYSTHPFCAREGVTFYDLEDLAGVYVNIGDSALDPSDYITRVGVAQVMRRYNDHDMGGCRWFITGLWCP